MENKKQIVSLILKLIIVVASIFAILRLSITMGAYNLLYFTLQSNIWITIASAVGFVLILLERKNKKNYTKKWMYIVKFIFTVAITITCLVFCFVLAPTLEPSMVFTLENILLHITVPVCAIADFFVFDCQIAYKKKYAILTIIPFMYYLAFASIGFVCNWDFGLGRNYPYFFMNWNTPAGIIGFSSEFPYAAPPYWGTTLTILVVLLGLLYIKLANKRFEKIKKK